MPSRSRFTSPVHAGARFVAQRLILKPVVWRLTTVTVLGREQLADLQAPFVVVSNHSSHLDAPLILGALPRKLARYVAAGAAADYFFDVWWRKGLTSLFFNAFPVDRTGLRGRKGMATSLLDDGVPLLLFPEGTRSKTGELAPFKPGAAALCISRDVPCVPVAIVGAHEAMPRDTGWPGKGRPPVYVTFGEPMHPDDGETPMEFSDRIAKEVVGLVDYTTTYRELHPHVRSRRRSVES
ncbi:lysophospholipid acyltransferase family protein [Microlunatus ginsengisoli]|uniref:lysophospholipid acyltransferase family protein n=1 Tax=Microlunatus ginsengisoli TaxID=363863 RepID=UPI0031D356DA